MDLGIAKTCEFGDHLILGFSKKWFKFSDGKPLEFQVKIEKNQLVLSTSLGKEDKTNHSISEETDGST